MNSSNGEVTDVKTEEEPVVVGGIGNGREAILEEEEEKGVVYGR